MSNATLGSTQYQQQRVSRIQSQCDSYDFFNLLTCDVLLEHIEAGLPHHRERLFPPTETLSMFLAQVLNADSSCQNSVNKSAIQRISDGLPLCSTRTGAYCRARQRLPCELVCSLTQTLGALIDQEVSDDWLWKGKRVKIVDGTTLTMPDTQANQLAYPQQKSQAEGVGFPICRLVGVTSLSSGALLGAAIGPLSGKGNDEQTLLRSLQDHFRPGDVILGDAFYPTYFFILEMQKRGVDIVMEQHGSRRRTTDFRRGRKLGKHDHVVEIAKSKQCPVWMSQEEYDAAPDSLFIREFKVNHRIIVTTFADAKTYPKSELSALYKSRWQIELDIRNIKETLGMGVLRCKSPEMVAKEIWVYLLAYNLIRLLMAQSAMLFDVLPRQLSFKHCLQIWLLISDKVVDYGHYEYSLLFELMVQRQVGNRPGRVEPRAKKRRPKAYALLTESRHSAREKIVKNGQPKKLK